ncbi:5-deoxy-glucuronate isomerase [Sphingomonas adhaesiva]|uniref:5-deoxy-glucuronate isomerase n=1 Tax=Sphingomonas adhaesiva TaxID=28212 RepID=UPI002FF48436
MTLLVRPSAPDADGVVIDVTPASAGWTHVGFRVVRLRPGEHYVGGEQGREACLVLATGRATIIAGDTRFDAIGGREDVFSGAPTSVYVPAGQTYGVTAETPVELAICSAPAAGRKPVRMIAPHQVGEETRGQGTNTRFVRNILPDTSDIAESLLVVEVVTPGGHWSSYPPHKHDSDAWPHETQLEETYWHRLRRPEGFAMQRVYTDDRALDETMTIGDGDVVLVPRGYHPVAAAHGYDLYYLNVMAGPRRAWRFTTDPAFAWLSGVTR